MLCRWLFPLPELYSALYYFYVQSLFLARIQVSEDGGALEVLLTTGFGETFMKHNRHDSTLISVHVLFNFIIQLCINVYLYTK